MSHMGQNAQPVHNLFSVLNSRLSQICLCSTVALLDSQMDIAAAGMRLPYPARQFRLADVACCSVSPANQKTYYLLPHRLETCMGMEIIPPPKSLPVPACPVTTMLFPIPFPALLCPSPHHIPVHQLRFWEDNVCVLNFTKFYFHAASCNCFCKIQRPHQTLVQGQTICYFLLSVSKQFLCSIHFMTV